MKNSSYYIAPVGDRTHDLPHTVASNMVKVSHALNHSATERMGDESSTQVNHVMMDQLSDQVDKLCDIERQGESVYSWFVKDKQGHDILVTETGSRFTETGVRLTETGPMVEDSCGLMVEDSCGLVG